MGEGIVYMMGKGGAMLPFWEGTRRQSEEMQLQANTGYPVVQTEVGDAPYAD